MFETSAWLTTGPPDPLRRHDCSFTGGHIPTSPQGLAWLSPVLRGRRVQLGSLGGRTTDAGDGPHGALVTELLARDTGTAQDVVEVDSALEAEHGAGGHRAGTVEGQRRDVGTRARLPVHHHGEGLAHPDRGRVAQGKADDTADDLGAGPVVGATGSSVVDTDLGEAGGAVDPLRARVGHRRRLLDLLDELPLDGPVALRFHEVGVEGPVPPGALVRAHALAHDLELEDAVGVGLGEVELGSHLADPVGHQHLGHEVHAGALLAGAGVDGEVGLQLAVLVGDEPHPRLHGRVGLALVASGDQLSHRGGESRQASQRADEAEQDDLAVLDLDPGRRGEGGEEEDGHRVEHREEVHDGQRQRAVEALAVAHGDEDAGQQLDGCHHHTDHREGPRPVPPAHDLLQDLGHDVRRGSLAQPTRRQEEDEGEQAPDEEDDPQRHVPGAVVGQAEFPEHLHEARGLRGVLDSEEIDARRAVRALQVDVDVAVRFRVGAHTAVTGGRRGARHGRDGVGWG